MPSVINPRSGPFPVYTSTSPPTVDVGIFTISKTGVDLKTAATTTIFTVPTGRTFVATFVTVQATAVTSGGAGTLTYQLKESSASRVMSIAGTSASGTPVANQTAWATTTQTNGAPANPSNCTAGNSVQYVQGASNAGTSTITGTVYVTGFYIA